MARAHPLISSLIVALLLCFPSAAAGPAFAGTQRSTQLSHSGRFRLRSVADQNVTCVECPAGTESLSCKSDDIPVCPIGYCTNQTLCSICPIGWNATAGSYNCSACPAGWVSTAGSENCTYCESGSWADTETGRCRGCSAGTWSPGGSFSCFACGSGRYSGLVNASSNLTCLPCPAGYYCPNNINDSPLLCPRDAYCPAASVSYVQCSALHVSEPGSSACVLSNVFWLLLAIGCGVLVVILLLVIVRLVKARRVEIAKLEREKETAALIPEPLPGPVYGGY